jgi:YVTN family beta-propeller protein
MIVCMSSPRARLTAAIAFLCVFPGLGACKRSPSPSATAAATSGPRLYVSDETGGNIVIVDPARGEVVDRIPVGKRPRGLHLTHDGSQVLVALSGSPIGGPGVDESTLPPADRSADGIGLVDLASRKLARVYPSGVDPEAFDISPDGKSVYVSNEDSGELSMLDLASGTVKQHVQVGTEPEGVTVRPDGRVVYVTCEGDNRVVVVDATTLAVVAQIPTAARPRAIAFTPDGATAFVSNENGGAITVVDATKHAPVATIDVPKPHGAPTPARPMGLALSPDGRELFVSLGRAKAIAVLEVAGRTISREIADVGDRPWGIAISADGRKLYTANGPSADVSIVDVASGNVEKRIQTGGSPWGIVESR